MSFKKLFLFGLLVIPSLATAMANDEWRVWRTPEALRWFVENRADQIADFVASFIVRGDLESVEYLVDDLGVSANTMDNAGRPMLHAAIVSNLPEMVEFLIERGANPNAHNMETRQSMLKNALDPDVYNPEIVRILVRAKAYDRTLNLEDLTPEQQELLEQENYIDNRFYY